MIPFWITALLAFMMGASIGSFLNVCIYRMPLDLSVVAPRSYCPCCKSPIPWYRNIPIFSYLALRGKCATCKASISWRYPFIEILTGLLFVLIVARDLRWLVWPFHAYLMGALVVTTFVDLDHWIIPDKVTLPGIVIGFLGNLIILDAGWMGSLFGILFGGGSFIVVGWVYERLAKQEGIGGGDVKYLAMAGAFLGFQAALMILVISSMVGAVAGIALILAKKGGGKTAIPFGPFLTAATLIVFLFGDRIWQWYFSFQHAV